MSRFRNVETGMVVSVDDSKDARFASRLFEPADKAPAKKAASKPADKKPDTK